MRGKETLRWQILQLLFPKHGFKKKKGELNYLPFLNGDDDSRELKHQTFLSIWTSNSRGETGSISTYVT